MALSKHFIQNLFSVYSSVSPCFSFSFLTICNFLESAAVFFQPSFVYSFIHRLHQAGSPKVLRFWQFCHFCMRQCLAGVSCRTIKASVPSPGVLPRQETRTRQELRTVWLCLTAGGKQHQPPNFQSSHSQPAPDPLSHLHISFRSW